jgi:CBS domain-containing protein
MEKGLVGVVSHSDIVRHSTQSSNEPDETHDYYLGMLQGSFDADDLSSMHLDLSDQTRVSDIMTTTVFRVDVDTSVAEIARIMTTGRVHRLFVTRLDVVVGVVAALDMIELLVEPT